MSEYPPSVSAGRFGYLTAAILSMLLLRPFMDGMPDVTLISEFLVLGIFLTGAHAAQGQRFLYFLAWGLVVAGFAARMIYHASNAAPVYYIAEGLTALFFINAFLSLAAHIRSTRIVTLDLINAAVAAYLLLGLIWAYVYLFLEAVRPGSFTSPGSLARDSWAFIYFSFDTLTSLGYSGIAATNKSALSLAIVEVIVGQLYLAILIGRLVGAYSAEFRGPVKP